MAIKLEDVQQHAKDLEAAYADRDTMLEEMENIYFMRSGESTPNTENIKTTLSPIPRTKVDGAVRLLTAAEPVFSVPMDVNSAQEDKYSTIERAAKAISMSASRVRQRPWYVDAVFSGILYSEAIILPKLTSDLAAMAPPESKSRAEDLASRTPIIFEVINPRTAFTEQDDFGLSVIYTKQTVKVARVISAFAEGAKLLGDKKPQDDVTLCEWFDSTNHFVWIDENKDRPLLEAAHGWPFVPASSVVCEGSSLFTETDENRQPFLYGLYKSNLWKRHNLALTVYFTRLFQMGVSPVAIYQANSEDKGAPFIDFSADIPTAIVGPGEQYGINPLNNLVSPQMLESMGMVNELTEASTLFSQALGQPMGSNAPYSMVALLSQSGRLPLVPYQKMLSQLFADAMHKGLMMFKQAKGKASMRGEKGALIELTPESIPDRFELDCSLEVSLPQDEKQNVVMAMQATGGESPLVSRRYARENWLKIGQSDVMEAEIWKERAALLMMQMQAQQQTAQMAQQVTGQMQPQMPGQPPMQSEMQMPQNAQPGMPLTEPLPPVPEGGQNAPNLA